MKLSTFILGNMEQILAEWEAFARTLLPACEGMSIEQLRDHAQQVLATVARNIEAPQTAQAQVEKSQGKQIIPDGGQHSAAGVHGYLRGQEGFTLAQMVSEYRALRASVLRLRTQAAQGQVDADDLNQMTRFNEALDQAVSESSARFSASENQRRQLFLAALGHDLRTPLGTILMSAQVLRASDTPVLEKQRQRALTRIVNSGIRMQQMLNDLMDFTLTEISGSLKISSAAMDFGMVVRHILDEVQGLYPARRFTVVTSGDLQGTWDEVRIERLVSNLLVNAAQHGSDKIPATVSLNGEDEEVRLVVENDGPPIPGNLISSIFDPLRRGSPNPATKPGSTANLGLGLYIAREIVLAHQGSIRVSSTEEAGTAFTVLLPRKQAR